MPTPIHLTADDPRLAPFYAVGDPTLVRTRGLFVAEGRRVVEDVLETSPGAVAALLLTEAALGALAAGLESLPRDVPVYVVRGPAALRDVTGFRFHQGALALVERHDRRGLSAIASALESESSSLVILEGVTDPDNVGAIFRTAAAFAVSAVLVGPGCASPLYRKALRTSMGTVLRLPWCESTSWPGDLAALTDSGLRLLALTPDASARRLDEVAREAPAGRRALLLGSEERGLSEAALAAADVRVRIPMSRVVDSLNVAAAAAVAIHELARTDPQRA